MADGVVITGLGLVTGLGIGREALWSGLVAGRSAIGPIRSFDACGSVCRLGVEVEGLSAKDHVPKHYRKATKVMARDTELAVVAASLAAADAGLVTREAGEGASPTYAPGRLGCHIGAGLLAAETAELVGALATSMSDGGFDYHAWGEGGMNNLPPLWMLKYLPNMLACHVTIVHGCEGPSNTITCAEASGLLSIAESMHVIERGDADVCLAGGAESKLNLMGQLRMELAGRLASCGEGDEGVVRPYDEGVSGGVPGEAGGLLVVERASAARERGATAYAEVVGTGAGHAGPPLVPPLEDPGEGAFDEGLAVAIESALAEAGIGPGEVDAIVPHGSGVTAVDRLEAGALRRVFGDGLGGIELVTLVPLVGECMAGAGGVAVGVGAMCLREQRLPARVHGGRAWDGMCASARDSRESALHHVLVCTNAMGGQSAAVVLRGVGR